MGEEFPLDPNQVQPPQEGQFEQPQEGNETHIQVTSHEGDAQLGEVALSVQPNDAEHNDGSSSDDGGDVPSTYIRNEEKAEVMAHAQNHAFEENDRLDRVSEHDETYRDEEWAGEYEGREYEVRNALTTYAHEGVTTPEEALRLARHDRSMFLKYGHAIAENHRKHGDKLSLELEAIDKVYDFQEKITKLGGDKLWASQGYRVSTRENATIKTANGYYGELDVLQIRASGGEEWALSMFDDGEYKVSKTEFDPNAEFQEVQTIKTRNITEADVAHLGETLNAWVDSGAKTADAEKKRRYYEELEAEDEENDMRKELAFQRHLDDTGDWQEAQRRAGVTPSR